MSVDDMFSKGGLVVFLLADAEVGYGSSKHRPRLPVDIVDTASPVYVDRDDLSCPECGEFHEPPERNPAKWLAFNKALNGGVCPSCDR